MNRFFYRAQVLAGNEEAARFALLDRESELRALVAAGDLATLSVYRFGRNLFIYYESVAEVTPDALFPNLLSRLEVWPGEEASRFFVPMIPVYEACQPKDDPAWREGSTPLARRGMLMRLKPAFANRYIFLHYQLQEESALILNKFLAIAIHENLLFYYDELPPVAGEHVPSLSTHNTPSDWDAAMEPHFQYWQDVDPIYKRKRLMEAVLSI